MSGDAMFDFAHDVAASIWGRACTYRPMAYVPNSDPETAPDTNRAVVSDLSVIFSEAAERVSLANNGFGRAGSQVQTSLAGKVIFAGFGKDALPYRPIKNDEIERGDDGKRYRVAEVLSDGLGGYQLRLNEA